jgi:tetratricopeptide (TPR) repeat protein
LAALIIFVGGRPIGPTSPGNMIHGFVQDRPWGKTLGALARRGVSGQLTVRSHNARFQIAFHQGLVIAAASPGSAENLTTLAFRQNLITPAQLEAIQARSSEDELLAEYLASDQLIRLQRQALAACVARTFVFEHGDWSFDAQITLPIAPHNATHIGGLIYHGARMHLGEDRLRAAIHALGSRFTTHDRGPLRHFSFQERERRIVDVLLEGTSASLLDAISDAGERRIARAAVYALATSGVFHCEPPHARASSPRLARGTTDPDARRSSRTLTPRPESATTAYQRGETALREQRLAEAIPALERAHQLAPDRIDYQCTLAWARFTAATDKLGVAESIRSVLLQTIRRTDRPALPHYYLGLVERTLGRDDTARAHFQQVLSLEPDHENARSQV